MCVMMETESMKVAMVPAVPAVPAVAMVSWATRHLHGFRNPSRLAAWLPEPRWWSTFRPTTLRVRWASQRRQPQHCSRWWRAEAAAAVVVGPPKFRGKMWPPKFRGKMRPHSLALASMGCFPRRTARRCRTRKRLCASSGSD